MNVLPLIFSWGIGSIPKGGNELDKYLQNNAVFKSFLIGPRLLSRLDHGLNGKSLKDWTKIGIDHAITATGKGIQAAGNAMRSKQEQRKQRRI